MRAHWIAIASAIVAAAMLAPTASAGCTSVYGLVQPRVYGCSYTSEVWEVCYEGNSYGWAWMELGHKVINGWEQQVYWQSVPGRFESIIPTMFAPRRRLPESFSAAAMSHSK